MGRILIIGAGGVATVAAHKVCQNPEVFTEVMIASRTEKKCIALAEVLNKKYGTQVRTAQVDADSVEQLVALFSDYKPELVLNLALPYQDLHHGGLPADRMQLYGYGQLRAQGRSTL